MTDPTETVAKEPSDRHWCSSTTTRTAPRNRRDGASTHVAFQRQDGGLP
jgi:hypothetical protein